MKQDEGHARFYLLLIGVVGEILIGGTIFGWNALSVVLKDLGLYGSKCSPAQGNSQQGCSSQDSRLAVAWNVGVFAVNFGPAMVGVALDYFGPRVVATAGAASASLGIFLMGEILRSWFDFQVFGSYW
jgi:hypothetical protein